MARMQGPLLIGCCLLFLVIASEAGAQTPVPSTTFQITGTQLSNDGVTRTYRAFRNGTDPFRVVCSEPCTADLNAIYGLYAGFASVYQTIVALFGVPATVSAQPFDLHIDADDWCGPEQPGIGGDSAMYSWFPYSGLATGSYGCFWFTTQGHYFLPFQYPDTTTAAYHLLTAHEFTHTEFFNRHHYSYEDFAKAISFYIYDPDGGSPVTDPCDDRLNELGNGKLLWLLCHRSGFQYSHLAPAFTALDNLYTSGQGQAYAGTTSVYQFRSVLNAAIGSNTLDAFLAAKASETPQAGSNGTLPYGGGRATGLAGWVSFLASVNALTADFPFHLEGRYVLSAAPPGLWSFNNVYELSGTGPNPPHSFEDSVYVRVKYDPSLLDFGTDESTLRLYKFNGTAFQLVADSRVDASKMEVAGPITSPGIFALAASSTTVAPTLVLARAVTNANVHTRVVLRNPSFAQKTGTLIFHPQGIAASPSDPTQSYSLAYGQTLLIDDIVTSFGATGSGSIDIVATAGSPPDVYAVGVETGTSTFPGAIVPVHSAAAALSTGDRGVLTAPGNVNQEQFGFLVRTFGGGVSFTVIARDANGAVVATTPLSYAANTMLQISPQTFTGGAALQPAESFDITVQSGSALIMSEEAGRGTASHLFRLVERVNLAASSTGDTLHLPKADLSTKVSGATLRTALQLTNPGTTTVTGHVRFSPADGSAPAGFNYSIPPGATRNFTDVVARVGKTGPGAIDIQSTNGNLPIAFGRLIYSGGGTKWQVATESAADDLGVLQAGDRTVLVAPNSASQTFNIGVRTFNRDLAVTMTVWDASGVYLSKVTQTFAASTSSEQPLSNLLGLTLIAGQVVEITIDGGNGLIYGSAVNTTTGSVNYQAAKRLPYY